MVMKICIPFLFLSLLNQIILNTNTLVFETEITLSFASKLDFNDGTENLLGTNVSRNVRQVTFE